MQIPLIQGSRKSDEIDYRDALNVNMYAVPREILNAGGYITPHAGLESYTEGQGRDRGAIWNERLNIHFRVSGDKLISIDQFGTVGILGTIPGDDQVSLPYSFNTQAIIGDGKYFLYDPTNGFRQVFDTELGTPLDATWIDGFYFFTDGENLYHTTIRDETEIDPLEFATSEFSPDPTIGVERDFDNTVIAFNRYTIEYFRNDATADFAFTRLEGRAKSIGLIGTHAKASIGSNWIMIGGSKEEQPTIYSLTSSSHTKVATREIDKILEEYSEEDLARAVIETRREDDIELVTIRLLNQTLLLNYTLAKGGQLKNAWSILKEGTGSATWPGANGVYDPRISRWVYGDEYQSRIGLLNEESPGIYGDNVEMIFYSPYMKLEVGSIDRIELETIPGYSGETVRMFLSLTYDGVSYGREASLEYGKPYDRSQRFIARRLGYIRDNFGFRFRAVTQAKITFANFEMDYG